MAAVHVACQLARVSRFGLHSGCWDRWVAATAARGMISVPVAVDLAAAAEEVLAVLAGEASEVVVPEEAGEISEIDQVCLLLIKLKQ